MENAADSDPQTSCISAPVAAADAAHLQSQPLDDILGSSESVSAPVRRNGTVPGPPLSHVTTRDAPQRLKPPFVAADYAHDNKKHLLLGASGSVATIKIPKICEALSTCDQISIRVVLTSCAAQFLTGQSAEQPTVASLLTIPNVDGVYTDEDEWAHPWVRGASILHIELRRWSDLFVVAPLSANTMARMVNGIADNLLTSILRAWDTTDSIERRGRSAEDGGLHKRVLLAAAMNTAMWLHPVTSKQLKVLTEEWGVGSSLKSRTSEAGWIELLMPSERQLACGDIGVGAMLGWEEIVEIARNRLYRA